MVFFVDEISKAISIGGDSDTIAAISGGITEVIYPIPIGFKQKVVERLDDFLRASLWTSMEFVGRRTGHG